MVTATVRDPSRHEAVAALGAAAVLAPGRRGRRTAPYDVVLELVGAPSLATVLPHLATWARVVVIGVGGGRPDGARPHAAHAEAGPHRRLDPARPQPAGEGRRGRRRRRARAAAPGGGAPAPSPCATPSPWPRRSPPTTASPRAPSSARWSSSSDDPTSTVIEAVLFDGDQTLWDFERVMREALIAVVDELRAARPGPFAAALRWQDLAARPRRRSGSSCTGSCGPWPRCACTASPARWQRRRDAEGGDEADDAALAEQLSVSYFASARP